VRIFKTQFFELWKNNLRKTFGLKRSDHSHPSSVRGSMRDHEEEFLRDELRETKRDISGLRDMFTFMQTLEQAKDKYIEGGSRRSRYHDEPHSQSKELYSSHHNIDYYQQPPRHNRPWHSSFPKESKVDFPPFYSKEHVEEFLV